MSTLSDSVAAAVDNADYETAGDGAKCAAFIKAVKGLLFLRPTHQQLESSGQGWDAATLQRELEKAELWWRANGSQGPCVTFADFSKSR